MKVYALFLLYNEKDNNKSKYMRIVILSAFITFKTTQIQHQVRYRAKI